MRGRFGVYGSMLRKVQGWIIQIQTGIMYIILSEKEYMLNKSELCSRICLFDITIYVRLCVIYNSNLCRLPNGTCFSQSLSPPQT